MTSITRQAAPGAMTDAPASDWKAAAAAYRIAYADWLKSVDLWSDALDALHEAGRALPPRPQSPPVNLPNIEDMTIREIKAANDGPEEKAAWKAYEQDLASWQKHRKDMERKIVGPAKRQWNAKHAAWRAAFKAVVNFPVSNLAELQDKLELIAKDVRDCQFEPRCLKRLLADVRHLAEQAVASNDNARPFDANDWITRATEAGLTFFVRDDELWIGSVAGAAERTIVEQLQAELINGRRQLVREALTARGLLCEEA